MSHGLFLGQLPWAITSGFMGNYSPNPYNFQHFNLCHISLVSKQKLVPNKQEGLAIAEYMETNCGLDQVY